MEGMNGLQLMAAMIAKQGGIYTPGARRPVPGARCPVPGARRPAPGGFTLKPSYVGFKESLTCRSVGPA